MGTGSYQTHKTEKECSECLDYDTEDQEMVSKLPNFITEATGTSETVSRGGMGVLHFKQN
jgi:hypothetical protein